MIHHGDCLEVMAAMEAGSVDAVVTDPPYGLSFMGKHWDHGLPGVDFWQEALRVLKPSHYLMAFGGTRTWHRLACAIEDAGFEIRDTLMWLYGSGFPKGKSCLKPAWEPIILARKPGPMRELGIEECRVESDRQDTRHGGGSTNVYGEFTDVNGYALPSGRWPANLILECTCAETREGTAKTRGGQAGYTPTGKQGPVPITRNVLTGAHFGDEHGKEPVRIHTDPNCPCAMLDGQTGIGKSGVAVRRNIPETGKRCNGISYILTEYPAPDMTYADSGGPSRFFYCAKASRSERNAGCEGMPESAKPLMGEFKDNPGRSTPKSSPTARANHHPTVKPLALMRWLVKLVAYPGDTVLDPFTGSGTTGVACAMEGREFVGIEREAEYVEIARRRIEAASAQLRLAIP